MAAVRGFTNAFGDTPFAFVSAPGRTELLGNHTDHQRGRVLAAAVSMDVLAAAAKNDAGRLRLLSQGYTILDISLDSLLPSAAESNTTAALMRGVAAGIVQAGGAVGGMDLYVISSVPVGSGLSSSAAIEVLLGTAFNYLYNENALSPIRIAQIGQYAENTFFGKPCGLMDQMASSVGGVVSIDFADAANPLVTRIPYDLGAYTLFVVNAGGSHADLTQEYADIPGEMCAVAQQLGRAVLGEVAPDAFFEALPRLRQSVSDRAILRALHFFEENQRVLQGESALRCGDMPRYCGIMLSSGDSSFKQLQNIYPSGNIRERSVALALSLAKRTLEGQGAWRVQGGGFAGTIQALAPLALAAPFCAQMRAVFGEDSCPALRVRPVGGYALAPTQP
jgi:galactokinase